MHAGRNLRHELCPVHAAGIANDIDTWQPTSLHEVIAGFRRLEAVHQALLVTQLATDADAVVMECLEKLQYARLQRGGHAAPAPTHAGNAGDGSLTDPALGPVAGGGLQSGIEGDGRPVEQLQSLDVGIEPP